MKRIRCTPIPISPTTLLQSVAITIILLTCPAAQAFSNTGSHSLPTRQLQYDNVLGRFSFQLAQQQTQHQQRRRDIFQLGTASSISSSDNMRGGDSTNYDPLETANLIHPHTKRLRKSAAFYAEYVIKKWQKIHNENKLQRLQGTIKEMKKAKKEKRKAMWAKLNDQRKNVVQLADYKAAICIPSFLFAFLGALMASITPSYYAKCVHCVSTLTDSPRQLLAAVIGLGITCTLEALFTGLRGSLFWIGGSRANYNVRVKLHRSLLLQETAFFDENETGYLLSRLNSDVNKIGSVISYHVNVVFRQFAQFVFGSMVLIRLSPKLALATFGGIGLVAWVAAVYGDFSRDLAEAVQATFAKAGAVAETSFSMSETIRAFNGVELESDRFESAQSKALELEEVQAWAYGTHKFVSDTLQALFLGAVFVACHGLGRSGGLSAAKLTTFIFYANFVLESSNEVGDQWAKIQGAVGASSSVFDLIKRIPKIRDPPQLSNATTTVITTETTEKNTDGLATVSIPIPQVNGDNNPSMPIFAVSNLTVSYDAMERPALDGVNLNMYEGDRVAIVGRSGSGKSSLLRTLLRFYDPSSGSVCLDGKDLREMTRAETSEKLAYVQQEPHLFPLTLIENVLYGIEKDDKHPETGEPCYSESFRQRVAESLALAGLPVTPGNELGLELDTRVGEGGRSLSGGQRQRVAIARAIIRSPEVLLLDEPTAALDSQSEGKVVKAIQQAMVHTKSMVMVTHRLGVVRALGVNRVIVLDKGKIVESGHPEELLRNENGLYSAMAREQSITANDSHVLP